MPSFYFRHSQDYTKVSVFNQKTLISSYGGQLAKAVKTKTGARVLGRIAYDDGSFREVRADDEAFAVKQDGKIIGYETGLSLGVVDDELDEKEVQR
jgi:hypothetical protein